MKRFAGLMLVVLAGTALAEDRFPLLTPETMTPAQKKVADAILSGPRGQIQGPFNAWLRSPEIADRFQKVGEYIRFNTSLPHHLNEFAILITAREWTSQYEWYVHHPLALKAGLNPNVAAALATGKRPTGMKADEELVYDFSVALHRNKGQVPDALFKKVRETFGEQGVTDLIAVNGYYSAVSMTLNVAEVALPPGTPPPLPILAAGNP